MASGSVLAASAPRFLLVRLGALGDIVHAVPVAAALRARWPRARIDWVVERAHRALADRVPILDHVVAFDSRSIGDGGWLALRRTLRAAEYDVAFDVQGLIKSAVVARLSGAERVVGFATRELREPAAAAFYDEQGDAPRSRHVIDRNGTVLDVLGITSMPWHVPLAPRAASDAIAAMLARGAPIVLNPGGGWPNKRWPPERFGAVARELRAAGLGTSLVLWGPSDRSLADEVVNASDGAAALAPPTTLDDLMHVVRAARVVVSGDTGPLHLAAAFGTPVVGIYGPTDSRRNGPWGALDVALDVSARCGCSHKRRCLMTDWCLAHVDERDVARAVMNVVSSGPVRAGRPAKAEARRTLID